jgi:hypothetical protein
VKIEKPSKRMTLREHITHAEKCTRDLIDHFGGDLMNITEEFRDLTRPVRRKSHYPTRVAVDNALTKLQTSGAEAMMLTDYLLEELKHIAESAKRELDNR